MSTPSRPAAGSLLPARPSLRRIEPHPTSVAAFVGHFSDGPENDAVRVRSFQDVEKVFGGLHPTSEAAYALFQFFLNGGKVAFVVRTRKGHAALTGTPAGRTGVHALLDLDPYAFNLLSIPDAARLDSHGQQLVYAAAARLCERQRAFLLCDVSARAAASPDALAWMRSSANPRTANGAVYFPRLQIPDPLNPGHSRIVPPSGTVAGVIARMDAEHGIWKTPAGHDAVVKGATPAIRLSDADARALNPRAVNVIRTLPSTGTVVWGARTLRGDASFQELFKYVSLRRLTLHVEQSVHRGLSWVVLERNGEALWSEITASVEEFLDGLFRRGALSGSAPEEAYFVRCDATTMTDEDASSGRVVIKMGIAPTKASDFLVLQVTLQAR